ncbi:MAG: HAD-IA family hydrolase [Oscillospiraceae bacterium]|nr:HAD-IA family hydrolase [Oscillospiraceae bacterium]
MQKIFDTIIFDLDGTLLNTLDDLADSMNMALAKCGFPQHTRDEIRFFVGNGIDMLVKRAMAPKTDDESFTMLKTAFSEIYAVNMKNKTRPYDGINEVLKALSEHNVKMAVVSNKHHSAVAPLIRDYFGEYIKMAVGVDENTPKKPEPTGTLKAISLLGSTPENTVYIGDSDVDIQTAKNAKVFALGCTWGFRDRALLEENGADMIIDFPDEMLKLFGI